MCGEKSESCSLFKGSMLSKKVDKNFGKNVWVVFLLRGVPPMARYEILAMKLRLSVQREAA